MSRYTDQLAFLADPARVRIYSEAERREHALDRDQTRDERKAGERANPIPCYLRNTPENEAATRAAREAQVAFRFVEPRTPAELAAILDRLARSNPLPSPSAEVWSHEGDAFRADLLVKAMDRPGYWTPEAAAKRLAAYRPPEGLDGGACELAA